MFVALKGHHGPVSQQVVSSCQQDWFETLGHALRLGEVAANFANTPRRVGNATMAFPAALAVEQMSTSSQNR
jgi:hypothetical protein